MANSDSMDFHPSTVAHPGEVLQEYLEFNAWTQRELARRSGLTPKTISEICATKAPVTVATALALEKVFGRPAHLWLNLQRQFEEHKARLEASCEVEGWKEWVARFPIADMQRLGWLPKAENDIDLTEGLLRFFGVSSPEGWAQVWGHAGIQYRQTRKSAAPIEAVSAWARATELEASNITTARYDEAVLRSALPQLRALTRERPEAFIAEVRRICARAGVAVIWLPELPRTGISGCARWLSADKALIALTLRYRWEDQVWFTLFHEVGHILLHKHRKGFIVDNAADQLTDNIVDPAMRKQEEEANRFAADVLIPPKALDRLIYRKSFDSEAIQRFAEAEDISPGIVVGRLQREGILHYSQGQGLKRKFDWAIEDADED